MVLSLYTSRVCCRLTDAYVPRHVLVFVVFLEEKAKYSSCAACSVRLKVQIDFWWRQQGFSQQEKGLHAALADVCWDHHDM